MNRKFIPLIIAVFILIAGAGLYFGRILKSKETSPVNTQTPSPSPAPLEMTLWEDQSEFSFEYPKNLKLDSHPEDNENYAHLELTSGSPGTIILWAKDSKFASLDDYLKGNKISNYLGSTLGSLPAAKILDASDKNKFSLLTIRNGYLYQIVVDTKGDNPQANGWLSIFNSLVDTYKFAETAKTEKNDSANSVPAPVSDDAGYEEEVIE